MCKLYMRQFKPYLPSLTQKGANSKPATGRTLFQGSYCLSLTVDVTGVRDEQPGASDDGRGRLAAAQRNYVRAGDSPGSVGRGMAV